MASWLLLLGLGDPGAVCVSATMGFVAMYDVSRAYEYARTAWAAEAAEGLQNQHGVVWFIVATENETSD